jgi:DNA-binding GntR family transcriptional regulator
MIPDHIGDNFVDNIGAPMHMQAMNSAVDQTAAAAMPRQVETVVEQLRDGIVSQLYPPGSRLREQDLADRFGVSRACIREALSLLAERRLVVRYPNRGVEVARLGQAEIVSIYEAREYLDGLCGRLATERTEPGSWQDMVQLFSDPAATAVANGDIPLYLSYIDQLTVRMVEAAANPVLKELLAMLTDRVAMLDRRSVLLPGRAERGLANHRLVIDAINRGDADEAERQKRRSLREARDVLLRYETQFTRKET